MAYPQKILAGIGRMNLRDTEVDCICVWQRRVETTSKDAWGVQPNPQYPSVGFRDLVKNKEQQDAAKKAAATKRAQDSTATTTTTPARGGD